MRLEEIHDWQRIHHPLTGVYVGCVWRDEAGHIFAEDRDCDVTDHDSLTDAVNWLCRWERDE